MSLSSPAADALETPSWLGAAAHARTERHLATLDRLKQLGMELFEAAAEAGQVWVLTRLGRANRQAIILSARLVAQARARFREPTQATRQVASRAPATAPERDDPPAERHARPEVPAFVAPSKPRCACGAFHGVARSPTGTAFALPATEDPNPPDE